MTQPPRQARSLGPAALLPVLLASPPPADAAVTGPYRVLAPLGQGTMGAVALAEQRSPVQRLVALKRPRQGQAGATVQRAFAHEARALASANHDHVVRLFDTGTTPDGQPYTALEYVPGLPITEYCDRNRLGWRARLELFVQLCDGVGHLHEEGVVHRDLKPHNVLVTEASGPPRVKIVDLGLAGFLHDGGESGPRGMLGTPGYLAPEQAAGAAPAPAADIYALGAILYELLAGAPPHTPAALLAGGIGDVPRLLRTQAPPTPAQRFAAAGAQRGAIAAARRSSRLALGLRLRGKLARLAHRAVQIDSADRPPSAQALATEVRSQSRFSRLAAAAKRENRA